MSASPWEILLTPQFWILTATGSIVYGIAANLVTPLVSKFGSRLIEARRSSTQDKRINRRRKVILRHFNINTVVSRKIDVVFDLLISFAIFVLVYLGVTFPDQLHISEMVRLLPAPFVTPAPNWLIIASFTFRTLFAVVGSLLVFRRLTSCMDDMQALHDADIRELQVRLFFAKHTSVTELELQAFYDELDRKTFGVNSTDDPQILGVVVPLEADTKLQKVTSADRTDTSEAPAVPISRSSSP